MKAALARALIERGVIQRGTVLQAFHNAKGLSGQYDATISSAFKLTGAQAVGEWVYFNATDTGDNPCRFRCDYVTKLDGMPISRVAAAQLLTEDGESIAPKRSRRRKEKPAADAVS